MGALLDIDQLVCNVRAVQHGGIARVLVQAKSPTPRNAFMPLPPCVLSLGRQGGKDTEAPSTKPPTC